MPALILLIIANLPTILAAGKAGFDFIASVRTAAKQSGEWTEEHEAEFQALFAKEAVDPAWQLDAPDVVPFQVLPPADLNPNWRE